MPDKLYEWLGRIKSAEREYSSLRLAADRLQADARREPNILRQDLRPRDIEDASTHLEATYIIRLFAEFESGLREFWATIRDTEPRTQSLLDGVAARRRIPHDDITNAHMARTYRNFLVHERDEKVDPTTIGKARHHLCQFLRYLPLDW